MEIKVLMENTTANPELAVEPGLSLYVETQGKKILFWHTGGLMNLMK